MGVSKAEQAERYNKLLRYTCDILEGKYVLPNGKMSKPGKLNQSELLRAAGFPENYSNAYRIFSKEEFKNDLVTEQARRRDIDVALPEIRLDGEEDDALMTRLINRELLHRLRYAPGSIETDTLLRAKQAVEKKKPAPKGEGGDDRRRLPDINQLVIMLNGRIPEAALAMLPQAEVIDAEAEEA